jgi:hypothetical protein
VRIGATVQLHVIKLTAGGSQQSHLKFEFIEGYVTFGRLSVNKLKSVILIWCLLCFYVTSTTS